MNRSVTVLLGVVAGTVVAFAASTSAGRRIRSNMTRMVSRLKESMSSGIEMKARKIHESEVLYS